MQVLENLLLRIDSGYFVAGAIAIGEEIVMTAPIIRYMKGWSLWEVYRYCARKGWQCLKLSTENAS